MPNISKEFISVQGMNYHVVVKGSGLPILFLHGFTGSGASWREVMPALHQSHFQTITIDLLGHGLSDAPLDFERYRMENVAADIAGILPQLTNQPIHLLGYSMGGRLALYLALHYPHLFHSLILESASPGLPTEAERKARRQADETLADWIEWHGLEACVDRWEQLPVWDSQAKMPASARAKLREQRLRNRVHGLANSLRGMGTGGQPSLWERLGELGMPALLLAGGLDKKFVAVGQGMESEMPNARLEIVENAGHAIHLEQPKIFSKHLLSFINSSTSP